MQVGLSLAGRFQVDPYDILGTRNLTLGNWVAFVSKVRTKAVNRFKVVD